MNTGRMPSVMTPVKSSGTIRLSRRAKSRATHWRIVKAAYERFCEYGYAGTTMVDISETAGVAVQTVYFIFHTKGALLSRAIDYAVMGDAEPAPPESQPWYQALVAVSDIEGAVRQLVDGVAGILARVAPINLVARTSGESEVDEVLAFHAAWQRDAYREILGILLGKASLRPGLTTERATDLLLFFLGDDAYQVLVVSCRWTPAAWADWTAAIVLEHLFDTGR